MITFETGQKFGEMEVDSKEGPFIVDLIVKSWKLDIDGNYELTLEIRTNVIPNG
jgi:hypothetical protein